MILSGTSARTGIGWHLGLLTFLAATGLGCGSGGGSTPTSSSPVSPAATITLSGFTASVETSGTGLVYRTSFQINETSGRANATINTIAYTLGAGFSANANPTSTMRVGAGATVSSGTISLNDSTGATASTTSITVTVGYSDDGGRSGTVSSSASVTQPPPPAVVRVFTLVGVISDITAGRAVAGATVAAVDSTSTRRTSVTDGNGYFSIASLREGSIALTITATGYQTTTRTVSLSADTKYDVLVAASAQPPVTSLSCGAPQVVTCINGGHQGTPTARCVDSAWSCSTTASGTCSGHGGIACRVCPGPLC